MSGLCGWWGESGTDGERESLLTRMGAALPSATTTNTIYKAGAALATVGSIATTHEDQDILVAVAGTVFDTGTHQPLPAAAISKRYRERGADCLGELSGGYALALYDQQNARGLLAVDRMGIGDLTYTCADGLLVFGTSADALRVHPKATATLDHQALYHYLYFHMVPGPGTIYREYQRLLPGYCLVFAGGQCEVKPYWRIRFAEHESPAFDELKHQFLSVLEDSVRALVIPGKTGSFMSGGTDSSTLAGLLGRVTGAPANTYSIGFAAEGYDEMAYARIAAQHFGTNHHEYYVTPDDVATAIPLIAGIYAQPFGNSSAVPTYYCARLARGDGMERILGGDGGDELFGGNERYGKQWIFSLYEELPASLRHRLIEPALSKVDPTNAMLPLRKLRSYVEQARIPMPARLETYNLMERLGPANVLEPDFLAGIDRGRPVALLESFYGLTSGCSLVNRMLALDFKFTLADNDLPKVINTCELAGIDVGFPMLGHLVVDFSARLAPSQKLRGTRLRYFFKEALRDFLPPAIISKEKHGFGLPFGPWMANHPPLNALARDNLADLKSRGIVRPDFIDELTGKHLTEHAGYYGTMIWVLMMLELWFKKHRASATG